MYTSVHLLQYMRGREACYYMPGPRLTNKPRLMIAGRGECDPYDTFPPSRSIYRCSSRRLDGVSNFAARYLAVMLDAVAARSRPTVDRRRRTSWSSRCKQSLREVATNIRSAISPRIPSAFPPRYQQTRTRLGPCAFRHVHQLNPLTRNNVKLVYWPLMGRSPSRPLLAVPNVTAHPSTASVPITVLLYNGRLLCGFNVLVKGLNGLVTITQFVCCLASML